MFTDSLHLTIDEPSDGTRDADGEPTGTNRDRRGRIVSAAVGGTLLALGIRRRSLGGAATALVGGWLLYRGAIGNAPLDRAQDADDAVSHGPNESKAASDATVTERSVTVGKSADELYELWWDPETMSRVFGEFVEVTASGEDRWRWTVNGPLGRSATWETRIVEDRPGEVLRWTSSEGAIVPNEGSIHFRPVSDDRGTEVTFETLVDPPGGVVGDAVTKRLGVVPDALAGEALRRFKSLAETGEIPTLERNPSARGKGDRL